MSFRNTFAKVADFLRPFVNVTDLSNEAAIA